MAACSFKTSTSCFKADFYFGGETHVLKSSADDIIILPVRCGLDDAAMLRAGERGDAATSQ